MNKRPHTRALVLAAGDGSRLRTLTTDAAGTAGDALQEDVFRVVQFLEKPPAPIARALIARGARWNSFILAADGNTRIAQTHQPAPARFSLAASHAQLSVAG